MSEAAIPAAGAAPAWRSIFRDGLWWNNPGLAQLLGLCPLLAVSNTVVTGFGLGVATVFVLTCSNLLISLTRHRVDPRVRLPAYVLIIAAFVTAVDLLFEALWFDLYRGVGLFVALIVTNCVILGRAEAFASRHPPCRALADGLAHGLGFLAVLVALGAMRELIGFGSLFRGADLIFGPGIDLTIAVTADRGLLLATLPPGAFFGLACLVAARKAWFDRRRTEPAAPDTAALPQT